MIRTITRAEYEKLPNQYRETIAGVSFILTNDPDTGGTVLAPVEITEYKREPLPLSTCQYSDHPMKPHSGYVYADHDHGIPEIRICKPCYAAHLLKYYPDSRVADHIRQYPEEYTEEK